MPIPITIDHQAALSDDGDGLVALGVRVGHVADDAPGVGDDFLEAADFTGAVGQTVLVTTEDGVRLLVGLGDEAGPTAYRKAGAAVAAAAVKRPSVAVDALVDLSGADRTAAADALAEGLALGSYRFTTYKDPGEEMNLASATVLGTGGKRVGDAVARGAATAEAMGLVRDLVNTPGGDMTPSAFAERARQAAEVAGLDIEVLDRGDLVERRLGGILGVARGSQQEPCLVKLTHRPDGKAKGRVALVGKGVTFDAGGLSIKSAKGMETMKGDMAGAATVLGAMTLVPARAAKVEVTAWLPLTDNMLGPDATRPGDVLRIRNDKTVEVLNTDAEGRLILADALSLAAEDEPDAVIDLATLTGAIMSALGDRTAGLFGNHQVLRERVADAAEAAGEAVWPMPMPAHLRAGLDSEVADLRNIGANGYGGASTAALFLQEFVGEASWAHLDIAGPADASSAYDEVAKGGTGFGVRTLAILLAGWTKLPAP